MDILIIGMAAIKITATLDGSYPRQGIMKSNHGMESKDA